MKTMKKDLVEYVGDNYITLECHSKLNREKIITIGGKRKLIFSKKWKLNYASAEELGKIFSNLRDLGFLFAGGSSGWPPAEVFKSFREKGLVMGNFMEIVWSGGGKITIYES